MDFSSQIISLLLHFVLIVPLVCPINSSRISKHQLFNKTSRSDEEFHKMKKMIATRLQEINKPASPDGDIVDCVLTHKQPAFDHPLLKGQKPLDPPEKPSGHNQKGNYSDIPQLWRLSGESCPEGTIPIRRITEQDLLRADSISHFGRKYIDRDNYELSIGSVQGDGYTGASAILNVWRPKVEKDEFSAAKISIASQKSGDIIEAGWHVFPNLYGDDFPRLFTYWTSDLERQSGCFNLKCVGFVQTSKKNLLGGRLGPVSTYNGKQYDFPLIIWKDPNSGNWWLEYGSGNFLGYWPATLFTELKGEAYIVEFGGEVLNLKRTGSHTTTQMGSGHFEFNSINKVAFIRNMQVSVTEQNVYIDLPDPDWAADKPECYPLRPWYNKDWGNYMHYGGPGKSEKCP
ncbi:carboxyl-terminal peptidase [Medicago truncatula]|uniref:Carboxyl-terminal peptidase n=1 Tax=Medicago truncatula TaxID=3880 RepID=A0A072TRZ5_MEDTR|nr:carboxyl-terminal peptidase [Medicago truncatula]